MVFENAKRSDLLGFGKLNPTYAIATPSPNLLKIRDTI